MQGKTSFEYDSAYADISYGTDKYGNACMDFARVAYVQRYLKQDCVQKKFFGSGGWTIGDNVLGGGFAKLFTMSKVNDEQCVVKTLSLVQLLGLGLNQGYDEKSLLEEAKNTIESRLEYLKTITGKADTLNLCDIQNYILLPYCCEIQDTRDLYSYVLTDYIICIKQERLVEVNYISDFYDANGNFLEDRLINYGIQLCESLIQLKRAHRDIHPGNIMKSSSMSGDNVYKLIDFDSMLDENCTTTRMNFHFTGKHTEPVYGGNREYTAPEVRKNQFDIRGDIYSVGYVLYDIANYDYINDEFNEIRPYEDGKLLKCENLSYDLFEIIQIACSNNYMARFQNWEDFLTALKKIKNKWKRKLCIKQIDDYDEWICEKNGNIANMRRIFGDNSLVKEYHKREWVYKKVCLERVHFPKIIDEVVDGNVTYIIEELPQGIPLRDYLKKLGSNSKRFYFGRTLIANYVDILNRRIGGWRKKEYVSSYCNLISPDNIFVTDSEEIWLKGIAVPQKEYRDYILHGSCIEYILAQVRNNEKGADNASADIYAIGMLIYELLTGSTKTGIENKQYNHPVCCIKDPPQKIGLWIDLANSCLMNPEEGYTLDDIQRYLKML